MDPRTRRRHRRLRLAGRLAELLNRPKLGKQSRRIVALANERPRFEGIDPDAKRPYLTRTVITARRPRGRVTLYWFAKAGEYRVKIDPTQRGLAGDRRLLLDAFAKVSGVVGRCPECSVFFAKTDRRQRYCAPACGSRRRQRRHRANTPAARAAYAESMARREGQLSKIRAAQYAREQGAHAADLAARNAQRRFRRDAG
jgi:hypothetical protein